MQTQVKNCQVERDASEPNIATIMKTHDKVKREEKRILITIYIYYLIKILIFIFFYK